jgi:hypothetical protein
MPDAELVPPSWISSSSATSCDGYRPMWDSRRAAAGPLSLLGRFRLSTARTPWERMVTKCSPTRDHGLLALDRTESIGGFGSPPKSPRSRLLPPPSDRDRFWV